MFDVGMRTFQFSYLSIHGAVFLKTVAGRRMRPWLGELALHSGGRLCARMRDGPGSWERIWAPSYF